MAFYGKYEDDEPSLAQRIARELSRKNDDDDVRLTARYCNSDGGSYSEPKIESAKPEPKVNISKLKVGDVIQGLEHLGPIVSITDGTEVKEEPEDRFSEKKIKKFRKWLEKKGFSYEGEYKGQHSYWLDDKDIFIVTDPNFIIFYDRDSCSENEQLIYKIKEAKSLIKLFL